MLCGIICIQYAMFAYYSIARLQSRGPWIAIFANVWQTSLTCLCRSIWSTISPASSQIGPMEQKIYNHLNWPTTTWWGFCLCMSYNVCLTVCLTVRRAQRRRCDVGMMIGADRSELARAQPVAKVVVDRRVECCRRRHPVIRAIRDESFRKLTLPRAHPEVVTHTHTHVRHVKQNNATVMQVTKSMFSSAPWSVRRCLIGCAQTQWMHCN